MNPRERCTFDRLVAREQEGIARAKALHDAGEEARKRHSDATATAKSLQEADREYRRQVEIRNLSQMLDDQIGAEQLVKEAQGMLHGGDVVPANNFYAGFHDASWDFWVAWGFVKSEVKKPVHRLRMGRKSTEFELSRIALGIQHRRLAGVENYRLYVRAGTGTATLREPSLLSSVTVVGSSERGLTHVGIHGDQILSATHYSGQALDRLLSQSGKLNPESFDLSPTGPATQAMDFLPVDRPRLMGLLANGVARVRTQLAR